MSTDLKRRPEWDEIHLIKAIFNAARSTCLGRNIGAELVAANGVDSLQGSYNGTPEGLKNCDEGGCVRCWGKKTGKTKSGIGYELCFCEHAEANAYARAARRGVSTEGSTLYSTHECCGTCLKEALSHGTRRVVFLESLKNEDPLREFINGTGAIKFEKYSGPMDSLEKARKLVKSTYGRDVY